MSGNIIIIGATTGAITRHHQGFSREFGPEAQALLAGWQTLLEEPDLYGPGRAPVSQRMLQLINENNGQLLLFVHHPELGYVSTAQVCVMLTPPQLNVIVGNVVTKRDCRGRGFARLAFEIMEEEVRTRWGDHFDIINGLLTTRSEKGAVVFYEGLGWYIYNRTNLMVKQIHRVV